MVQVVSLVLAAGQEGGMVTGWGLQGQGSDILPLWAVARPELLELPIWLW